MSKIKLWNMKKISEELNIKYITVNHRFASKFARERWGVVERTLPDGTKKKYVPEDKLYLWLEHKEYRGKPKK
jgi:hypothetical protein